MQWTLRTARPEDAERMAAVVYEGMESYRSFAPRGWDPPPGELDFVRARLDDPDVWCLLAEADGTVAGHVALMPASKHGGHPSEEPALAHLWNLFVRPPWWGSGLAGRLHGEIIREAGERGFVAMRLFTPAEQARARRFYEREGWAPEGEPFDEPMLGLALLEYRRAISSSV